MLGRRANWGADRETKSGDNAVVEMAERVGQSVDAAIRCGIDLEDIKDCAPLPERCVQTQNQPTIDRHGSANMFQALADGLLRLLEPLIKEDARRQQDQVDFQTGAQRQQHSGGQVSQALACGRIEPCDPARQATRLRPHLGAYQEPDSQQD